MKVQEFKASVVCLVGVPSPQVLSLFFYKFCGILGVGNGSQHLASCKEIC